MKNIFWEFFNSSVSLEKSFVQESVKCRSKQNLYCVEEETSNYVIINKSYKISEISRILNGTDTFSRRGRTCGISNIPQLSKYVQ